MEQAPTATVQTPTAQESAAQDRLPLLLILVAASGCAALIYEVVWYQLLPLAIGSTSVSLGILLAAFMGGLCIGACGCLAFFRPVIPYRSTLHSSWASAFARSWCGSDFRF